MRTMAVACRAYVNPLGGELMLWKRRGLVISPPAQSNSLWRTHCQMPILWHVADARWRLYFSGRDVLNRSHGFVAELDLSDGARLIDVSLSPLIGPGAPGAFDADGAMPSSMLAVGAETWMYYQGWVVRRDVPFQTGVGLAVSLDGGSTFARAFPGPVFGQGLQETFSASGPLVERERRGFKMYYSSVQEWTEWNGHPEPRYTLKASVSDDGVIWRSRSNLIFAFSDENEGGLSRPTVLRSGDLTHMWFSHRGWKTYRDDPQEAYRFGYATSRDGENWVRQDHRVSFINPPVAGDWDFAMQAYPAVIQVGDAVHCFYSGNGFGQSGIGYATLVGGLGALDQQT